MVTPLSVQHKNTRRSGQIFSETDSRRFPERRSNGRESHRPAQSAARGSVEGDLDPAEFTQIRHTFCRRVEVNGFHDAAKQHELAGA